jgi:hypothetical protein
LTTDPLPVAVETYFAATNAFDRDAVLATFTRNARVNDEGRLVSGLDEIAAWFDEIVAAYQPQFRLATSTVENEWLVVSTAVSGTFPGGEVRRAHRFLLSGARIAVLEIHD